MKKLIIMMCVLLVINLGVFIFTLWETAEKTIILYRMAILCNLAIFIPSLNLIHKEMKKNK